MTIRHVLTLAVTVAAVSSSRVNANEAISDETHGFTLLLPGGFVPIPNVVDTAPNVLHGFVLGDMSDDEPDITLLIEKMDGTIGRERLTPEDLPPGFPARLFTAKWQAYEVDAFEVPELLGEIEFVTFNVQIPIKRTAIQVKLFGPANRKSEMMDLLTETLNGLDGETNWSNPVIPFSPMAPSENYGFILLAMAVALILGGLVALWFVSKMAPRGTVLAIAAGIYTVGLALAGIRIREIVMLTGALKMLGFAGGILGVTDLVRKHNTRSHDDTRSG